MSKTLDLLRLTPDFALKLAIAESVSFQVDPNSFKYTGPLTGGQVASYRVEVDRGKANVNLYQYRGEVPFTMKRLDLEDIFSQFGAESVVDFPTTTSKIVESLTQRYKILFDEDDFEDMDLEYGDRDSFVLRSKPVSKRWYGEYRLPVKQRVLELFEAFRNNKLDFNDPLKHDLTESFENRFVSSINDNNRPLYRDITFQEIALGSPSVSSVDGFNTKIDVSVLQSDLYKGTHEFLYNRVNLNHHNRVTVVAPNITSYWEAMAIAAPQLDFIIPVTDVENGTLPIPPITGYIDLSISVVESSRGFIGALPIRLRRTR